jgi:hypothetical protein
MASDELTEARDALALGKVGRALGHAWDAAAGAATTGDQETLEAVKELASEIDAKDARRLVAYCEACIADLRAGIQYESPLRKMFKRQ